MIKTVNDYKKMKAVIFPGFRDAIIKQMIIRVVDRLTLDGTLVHFRLTPKAGFEPATVW